VRLNGRRELRFGEARFWSCELSYFQAASAKKNERQALTVCKDLHVVQGWLTLYRDYNNDSPGFPNQPTEVKSQRGATGRQIISERAICELWAETKTGVRVLSNSGRPGSPPPELLDVTIGPLGKSENSTLVPKEFHQSAIS
jgi:hypothetical protein